MTFFEKIIHKKIKKLEQKSDKCVAKMLLAEIGTKKYGKYCNKSAKILDKLIKIRKKYRNLNV